jgi:hypothetical protein
LIVQPISSQHVNPVNPVNPVNKVLQREGFSEHLAKAEKALSKAWEMNPKAPVTAYQMMRVELGQGLGLPIMETWFTRAMALATNYYDAVSNLYQDLPTIHGQVYRLRFAGNPNLARPKLQAFWAGNLVATTSFDTTGHSNENLGWINITNNLRASTQWSRQSATGRAVGQDAGAARPRSPAGQGRV